MSYYWYIIYTGEKSQQSEESGEAVRHKRQERGVQLIGNFSVILFLCFHPIKKIPVLALRFALRLLFQTAFCCFISCGGGSARFLYGQ